MKALPKSAWTLPSSLKRAQLQKIGRSIGAPLSGTKPELLASIHDVLDATNQQYKLEDGKESNSAFGDSLRVLSIDMGIRNLAYAFLTAKQTSVTKATSQTLFSTPILHKWQRINLTNIKGINLHDESPALLSAGKELPPTKATSEPIDIVEESFEPNSMARYAYSFAKHCTSLRPTHILIERQRFRTGGHSAVQEWSLRVGMLEGMLYSTFQTLKEENLLSNMSIEPMLPMRVNKYWFADQDVPATGKQAKQAKIAIVSDMLRAIGTPKATFSVSEDAKSVVESFGAKNAGGRTRVDKGVKALQKLDDMSDALLQGLAWLHWQENRVKLLTEGLDGLDLNE